MLDGKFGVPVNDFLDVMDEKFDKNIDWIFRVTNFQAFELGLGKLFHSSTVTGRSVRRSCETIKRPFKQIHILHENRN